MNTPDNTRESPSGNKNRLKLFYGKLASILGILLAIAGVFAINSVVAATFVGIALGTLGVALGERRLGIVAIVISVLVFVFGLAAISGLIPGLDPPGINDLRPGNSPAI